MYCQCWLPFASVISKAAIAHLGNVLCPYKVIGTGFAGTYFVLHQSQVPSVTSMDCSNALHSADPLLRLSLLWGMSL